MTERQNATALRPWLGLLHRQEVLRASDATLGDQRLEMEHLVAARLAGQTDRDDQERLLAQIRDGYEEQDRRVERTERRATTLLGAVTVITTIVGATGAILSSTDILD